MVRVAFSVPQFPHLNSKDSFSSYPLAQACPLSPSQPRGPGYIFLGQRHTTGAAGSRSGGDIEVPIGKWSSHQRWCLHCVCVSWLWKQSLGICIYTSIQVILTNDWRSYRKYMVSFL